MQTFHSERRNCRRDAIIGEPPRRQLESMIVGTYREMPGLSLSLPQAARLFGLGLGTCEVVLDDMVRHGALRRTADGQYGGWQAGAR
jgi:hypothetical protein